MGKIDELIKELCPNGVQYVKLGEAFDVFSGMTKVSKKWDATGNCKFIDYMNVYKNTKVNVNLLHNATVLSFKQNTLKKGDILYTCASETPNECAKSSVIQDYIEENIYLDDHLSGIRLKESYKGKFNPIFVNYYFYSWEFRSSIYKSVRGVTRFYIVNDSFKKIQIPLPPLSVQQQIVDILDTFTESISNLQEELNLREKQMEYYRENVLSFEGKDVKYVELGKKCDILTGYPFDSSKFTKQGVRLMRGMNIKRGYIDFTEELNRYWETDEGLEKYLLKEEDIVISMDGSLVGRSFAFINGNMLPLLLVQRVARIRVNEGISKYIYHYIQSGAFSIYVDKKKTKGAIPHISMSDISHFVIPVPSLTRQQEIVDILDTFESMITNIKDELELRQKQYEYYREKLLTFERKGA